MNFFKDLKGTIVGGEFYYHILKRPAKNAWAYYLILVSILAIIVAIFWSVKLNDFIGRKIAFFNEKIKKVEFVNGKIVNMPLSHKELQYENWTIDVDTLYVNEEAVDSVIKPEHLPALFVGPAAAFIASDDKVRAIPYPATYSQTIDKEYITDNKSIFIITVSICCLIGAFLYKFIIALIYTLLIITPIILFKFRRQGIKISSGFKVALYLSSFQLIASTILDLAWISLFWSFIVYILFYLFYIGGFVNIDFSDDASIKPTTNNQT